MNRDIQATFDVEKIEVEYAGCGSHALSVTLHFGTIFDDEKLAKVKTRLDKLNQALKE